jgi:hypothetical protein
MNINCILQLSAVFFYAKHIQVKRCSEQATGWTTDGSQFTSQPGQEFLSLLKSVQTSSMAYPVSSTMDIKGSFSGHKADDSSPSHAKISNV